MAITAESRHATKTKGFLLAKMLSLVEKMEDDPCPGMNKCEKSFGVFECCTDPNQQACCTDPDFNEEFCNWTEDC